MLIGELAVVAFLLVGYDRVAAFAGGHAERAMDHGRQLLALERALHAAVELRLNRALAPHVGLDRVVSIYYDFAHGTVTFAVLGLLYLSQPAVYRPARTALLAINVAALAVFAILPVAPPRLLPGSGFTDVVVRSHTWGAWESSTSAAAQHANLYAAFPSLHVASATWVLLAVHAMTRRRLLRGIAAGHLVITVLVVVGTGNHYLVDVAAGAALAGLAWYGIQLRYTRRVTRRPDIVRPDRVAPATAS
jgi:diacylglycerol O-acyltransferase